MTLYWPCSPAAAGLAVADVGAGEVLELERDVLGDVAGPGAVAEPRDEPAAPAERAGVVLEGRQQLDERLDEARDRVRRELLEHAEVDEHADDRLARPVVRAAQDARLEDAQRRLRARLARRAPCDRGPRAGGVARGRASRIAVPSAATSRLLASGRPRVAGRRRSARGGLAAAGQGVQGRRRDPVAPAQVEAVARRQRVQHDVADHERAVAAGPPRRRSRERGAVDDRDRCRGR